MINGILIEVTTGVRHKVLAVLLHFGGVTDGAILRGDDDMGFIALMLKGIAMRSRVYGVAFGAADHRVCQSLRYLCKGDPSFRRWFCRCNFESDLGVAAPFPIGNRPGSG